MAVELPRVSVTEKTTAIQSGHADEPQPVIWHRQTPDRDVVAGDAVLRPMPGVLPVFAPICRTGGGMGRNKFEVTAGTRVDEPGAARCALISVRASRPLGWSPRRASCSPRRRRGATADEGTPSSAERDGGHLLGGFGNKRGLMRCRVGVLVIVAALGACHEARAWQIVETLFNCLQEAKVLGVSKEG